MKAIVAKKEAVEMSKVVDRLKAWVASVSRPLALPALPRRSARSFAKSCGEGCYALGDGTLVPLGDLGVTPIEYLQP